MNAIAEIRDNFEFVPFLYPFAMKNAIKIVVGTHSTEAYQEYIYKKGIDQAIIYMPDLNVIRGCPSLKHLRIYPSYNAAPNFDYTPLYEAPEIKTLVCPNQYGDRDQYISPIDYSQINGLINLSVSVNSGTMNYNKIETLRSLCVGAFKEKNGNLTNLFCSKELDTLRLIECRVNSLDGIETSPKMQCLYLDYNRSLRDISALRKVKNSLKALRIENCSQIQDFSVLAELENLELLELSGSNSLPSLSFLKSMKRLKTFIFSMNVEDGDLTPCLDLSYVYSEKNRKHYNLKDKELPKGEYVRGNETIELWRRLE